MNDLERLARALKGLPIRDAIEPGGELDELRRREAARIVLQELRTPSEGMVNRTWAPDVRDPKTGQPVDAVFVWQAMIDHILSQETV